MVAMAMRLFMNTSWELEGFQTSTGQLKFTDPTFHLVSQMHSLVRYKKAVVPRIGSVYKAILVVKSTVFFLVA
jgi:hypothetical protein